MKEDPNPKQEQNLENRKPFCDAYGRIDKRHRPLHLHKKWMVLMLAGLMLGGCVSAKASGLPEGELSQTRISAVRSKDSKTERFDWNHDLYANTREDGSGTRESFAKAFDLGSVNQMGSYVDAITDQAAVTDSTAVMMTAVGNDPYAVGYLSLGSLNDSVKALAIDGIRPSAKTIRSGTYPVSRAFLLVIPEDVDVPAAAFMDYILSPDGQKVVEKAGYISLDEKNSAKTGSKFKQADAKQSQKAKNDAKRSKDSKNSDSAGDTGKIVVSGSSSVAPVMEKLREAYLKEHPDLQIEIQQSDSSTGIRSAADGSADLGMTSRDLSASEKAEGLQGVPIALDGIAVIVAPDNPVSNIRSQDVKAIFSGEETTWSKWSESSGSRSR